MTLTWSKSDQPKHPQARDIKRNCGQLLGRLDELLPCLYIAQYGASAHDLRERETQTTQGLFAVGARTGGDRPGVAPRVGLLLPLSLCRDEKARASLLEIPALIENHQSSMSDRRRAVQAKLDEAFGGDLRIEDKEGLDGFFALQPGPGLFRRLHESFDYVTEVLDNPAGLVRITGSSRFDWRSYGELMEWYHGLRGSDRFGTWSALTPFFVCGNTGALHSYSTERWARSGLGRPAEEPARWFVLRPGLADAQLGIRLEMGEYGWAKLHLTLDDATATIHLSEVFDPFLELLAWGREIDEGDLPVEMEIDEEGQEAVLTVLRTDDPQRVLLRVTRKYESTILLEGVVARATLAAALKAELIRFFTAAFDPQHWDLRGDPDDIEDDHLHIKDTVLNHPWLATADGANGPSSQVSEAP
ncbi:MAG: hypothetical protein BGP20_06945 [Thiobacillus sp. 63-78]|uniref:hypothetical protein n=1 Tax=Thiobacillus sp. 63-78 TaxID=1895859 RepID=UPI0009663048|nr:hypothetical protein [Thiobacillus sp. 63-78]OJZ15645.1 MAG: hypothetical protein BGP20_06945 [Thiobacillus sp. 63-78]